MSGATALSAQPIAKAAPASIIAPRRPIRSASQPAAAPAATSPVMKPAAAQPNQAKPSSAAPTLGMIVAVTSESAAVTQQPRTISASDGRAAVGEEVTPAGRGNRRGGVESGFGGHRASLVAVASAQAYATSTIVEVKR